MPHSEALCPGIILAQGQRSHMKGSSITTPMVRMERTTKSEGLPGRNTGPEVVRQWHMDNLGGRSSNDASRMAVKQTEWKL